MTEYQTAEVIVRYRNGFLTQKELLQRIKTATIDLIKASPGGGTPETAKKLNAP